MPVAAQPPQPPAAPSAAPDCPSPATQRSKLSPETRHEIAPPVTLTRLAHSIMLAWGWRRAADRLRAPALSRAGAGAVRCLAGPVRDVPGPGLADRWLGGRPLRRHGRRRRSPAGGSASAISSPGFTGSAMPSWSMPKFSAGCCRSPSSRCPPVSRCSPRWAARWRACSGRAAPMRILALAVALTIAEWLRGHVLTGFPWNTFGYALTEPLALAQSAALIGLWGLTFLAVAIFASPAVLADDRADTRRPLAAAGARRSHARGAGRLRRVAACAHADCVRRRREAAHHAAEPAAGREVQLRGQSRR